MIFFLRKFYRRFKKKTILKTIVLSESEMVYCTVEKCWPLAQQTYILGKCVLGTKKVMLRFVDPSYKEEDHIMQ